MGNLWILRLQFPKLLFAYDGVHEEAACVAKDLGVGEFAAPDLDDRLSHLLRRGVGDGFLGQGRTDVAIVELRIKLCGEPVGDGGDEEAVAPLVLEAALSVAVATVAALEAAEASRRYLHGLHLFDEVAGLRAVGLLGMAIEKVAYKPLRKATSPLAVLITAIGVSYLLQNVALLIFGANAKAFTSVVSVPALKLADGQINITGETIVTIVSCLIIMAGLMLFINKTKAGQAMLAVSEDKGAAQLMGINVDGTIALTFAIGSGLAAVAGEEPRRR